MIKFLARQKFRFDLGQSAFSAMTFVFAVIAASDKITSLIHWPAKVIIPAAVASSMLLIWALGYVMDRAKFYNRYLDEVNQRNEIIIDIHRRK